MKCKICGEPLVSTGRVLLESDQAEMECSGCGKTYLFEMKEVEEFNLLEG